MGILDILGPVIKLAGKALGLGGKAQELADALSGAPPEVRAQLARDLQEHERAMKALSIEELKTLLSEPLAMIQSEDRFVKRARPFGLYTFYVASVVLVVAQIAGATVDPAAILTILGPLAGVGGTYTYMRTREKLNGNGKE
ncbi:MAG: hypothetical protein L0Z53_06735 [Acidobacteriales bacterium]|nr:hypothetical protein [Terriglobales bacterium]